MLGIPWRTAFALQDDGWILRNAIVWHKPNAMPGGGRLIERWEPVIVMIPEGRRGGERAEVSNVLSVNAPSGRHGRNSFVGSKPAAWTRWVLDALAYDPAVDQLDDLFPGSGAVSAAADGMLGGFSFLWSTESQA